METKSKTFFFIQFKGFYKFFAKESIPINKITSKIVEKYKAFQFYLIILFQVSSEPVTRNDVIKLTEQLDIRLQQSQAKMLGICPIRRELFTQCFGKNTKMKYFLEITLHKYKSKLDIYTLKMK